MGVVLSSIDMDVDRCDYARALGGKRQWESRLQRILFDPARFRNLVHKMAALWVSTKIDKIVAFEALGFPFGAALAFEMKLGLVLARKDLSTIEADVFDYEKFEDYDGGQKGLKIPRQAIKRNDRLLLVDDWIEDGHQVRAAIAIIKRLGGTVVGGVFLGMKSTHDGAHLQDLRSVYRLECIGTHVSAETE